MLLSSSRRTFTVVGAVAAVAAAGAAAAPAGAATVKLGGGATTLKLDAGAGKALKSLGVSVSPTGKAKTSSSGIAFPIIGGSIDPASAAGTINHTGGLRLKAGATSLRVSDFVVGVGMKPTLSVRVNGGARLALLRPVLGKAKVTRDGLGTTVSGVAVHLTSRGAAALNKTFHVKAFKAKLKLGTVTIRATPAQAAFVGGQTDLALDPGAVAALTSLGVTPGLVGGATANADGSFAFPITGGKADLKTLAGSITHSGGISLTKGSTSVALTDFTVDTVAKQLTAVIAGGQRAAILDLDLSAPKVGVSGRTVTVGNVPAALTQGAADALNMAFATTAFKAGLKLGVATVRGDAA